MAYPLTWKDGQGYDIHVLRGGPPSKSLIDAVKLPDFSAGSASTSLTFEAQFAGAPNAHSVEVDLLTGAVTAHPTTDVIKLNNFLITARFVDRLGPGGNVFETEIRVHIHDSIEEIWLTPATLTIYHGADKPRFTVLARFSDQCIGDITDWDPSLFTFDSSNKSAVTLDSSWALQAVSPGGTSDITATVNVPALNLSVPAKKSATVTTKKGWADLAKDANVIFATGKQTLHASDARSSVQSVVDSATNILFVSEGFTQAQRGDFNNYVWKVTNELRTKTYLLPFPLLKDSINFWSVFVPSQDKGVTPLGEFTLPLYPAKSAADFIWPVGGVPDPAAVRWTPLEMIHELGMPILVEAENPFIDSQLKHWQQLYGPKATQDRTAAAYPTWNRLAYRSLLNERDTAFGFGTGDRPRASPGSIGKMRLGSAPGPRRTSDASIAAFIEQLTYGKPDTSGLPCNIGATWKSTGKDGGLVCFICLTDQLAGMQTPHHYFAATTGGSTRAELLPADANKSGRDIKVSMPERHSRTLLASSVSHECGHALGLWDEYGDGRGTVADAVPDDGNLIAKSSISSHVAGTGTVFNKTQYINWLWPRVVKGGVLTKVPDKSGTGLRATLRKGHAAIFKQDDIVQFREWPVKHAAGVDSFRLSLYLTGRLFKVAATSADTIDVNLAATDGAAVDMTTPVSGFPSLADAILHMFKAQQQYALVSPVLVDGKEMKVTADPILNQIKAKGPLSWDPDGNFDPGLCVKASNPYSSVTPTNLPALSNLKDLVKADIIGIYEGGNVHDCGAYRPAGRCKMRTAKEQLMPFCHVCRYLIVDRVDPTKHGKLDEVYAPKYPRA
jgi:IgA Peptidase M64